MGHATELQTIKAARSEHRCSWCAERIDIGTPYQRYRYYEGGDAGTVKLHPECNTALEETVREEGFDYEFFPGENPRGCNCGHTHGCTTCAERKSATPTAAPVSTMGAAGQEGDKP
jgi:hypothetical protein